MWLRESWRIGRVSLRFGNALWAGLAVWLMLGTAPSTTAFLTISQADPANVVATAKQFTISDVTATAQPGGSVLVSWSELSTDHADGDEWFGESVARDRGSGAAAAQWRARRGRN